MTAYASYNVAEIREQRENYEKHPFPHQSEAFKALSSTLTTPILHQKPLLVGFTHCLISEMFVHIMAGYMVRI